MEALNKAIDICGGAKALADKAGVSKASVYFWKAGKPISAESVIKIERATDGQVSRAELRPDLYEVA